MRLYLEIDGRFARLRKAGLPTSGAELNPWRGVVPNSENGALALTQAFSLLRTFPDSRSNEIVEPRLLKRTNEWSATTRTMVADYVQLNLPALSKGREALTFRQFQFPTDFSYGPDTPVPHLAELKKLALVIALQSCLAAEEGREQAWVDDVCTILKVAQTLDDEPTLISFLVRRAVIQMAVTATERNLNDAGLGVQLSIKLQQAVTAVATSNLLSRAFIGERAILIPCFRLSKAEAESMNQADEDGIAPPLRYAGKPNPFLWLTGFFERDLNFFLRTLDNAVSLAAIPLPESLILTNHFDEAGLYASQRSYLLSSLVMSAYSKIVIRDASIQASLRLAIAALAVEQYRVNLGTLPTTLMELTPQFLPVLPKDPFNGKPLRYQRLAQGYVLYSIGADGQDDGGRELTTRKKSTDLTSYDITFIVER